MRITQNMDLRKSVFNGKRMRTGKPELPLVMICAFLFQASAHAAVDGRSGIRPHRLTTKAQAQPTLAPTSDRSGKIQKVQDSAGSLTPEERSRLRFKLENLYNEVDLLVKNAATDRRDVQKQEREFKSFHVFQKIPVAQGKDAKFSTIIDKIKKSAQHYGLELTASKHLETSRANKALPKQVYSDMPDFQISDDQLVEKVRMDLTFKGTKEQLQNWMDSWDRVPAPVDPARADTNPAPTITPFLEWDPNALTSLPDKLSDTQWKVHAQAVLFRDVQYPKITPRDPMELLPDWARKEPNRFKTQEPLLWGLVEKTRATIPKALPKYAVRGQFQLGSARMTYFTSKITSFED